MVVKSEEDAPAPPGHVGRPRPGEHFDSLTLVELFDRVRQKYTHGSGEVESSDQSIAMCTTPSYETDVKVKHQQIGNLGTGNFANQGQSRPEIYIRQKTFAPPMSLTY